MLSETLKKRLTQDRPVTSITLRIPVDVLDSLKAIAPHKGFSGYQPLLKAYISEGLRRDESTYASDAVERLAQALEKRGVSRKVWTTLSARLSFKDNLRQTRGQSCLAV